MISRLRTLLILGRVSNLPTVWSNCLAGWWLGGGGNFAKVPFLLVGATFLYVGGMFLNDAFDVEFDRLHRKERPIPSGKISLEAVWRFGLAWLAVGAVILILLGEVTGLFTVILVLFIVIYDAIHKSVAAAPVLMGACRLVLYLIAASIGADGVTGWALWGGVAMMGYVVGLSFIARVETTPGALRYWPMIFLAAPIVLALMMNAGIFFPGAMAVASVVAMWILRCLILILSGAQRNIGRGVAGLLAGIVLVDVLAVTDYPFEQIWVFPVLFAAALLFQRFVPAS